MYMYKDFLKNEVKKKQIYVIYIEKGIGQVH